ncbi:MULTISPECIES: hypothetical protein [unclassified Methylobacterium]|nr:MULTISPECIES: hypothetical protein [unclassified Methylobacterium]
MAPPLIQPAAMIATVRIALLDHREVTAVLATSAAFLMCVLALVWIAG